MANLAAFEWDDEKATQNLHNHGVSFEEATNVFADPLARGQPDVEHSQEEARSLLMGESGAGRLLVVVYTLREERIRIISARLATRRERQAYEEHEDGEGQQQRTRDRRQNRRGGRAGS